MFILLVMIISLSEPSAQIVAQLKEPFPTVEACKASSKEWTDKILADLAQRGIEKNSVRTEYKCVSKAELEGKDA